MSTASVRPPQVYGYLNWCAVIPMANEEIGFSDFAREFTAVLDFCGSGAVYLVLDRVSKDRTLDLCTQLSQQDPRFSVVWIPENRHVVDAYVNGLRHAIAQSHEIVIEMDAGLSHDPRAIPMFLRVLSEGNECAFGSRYINGGSMADSPFTRRFLSKAGTVLAQILLGARLHDMTSGFQGFHSAVLKRLLAYRLFSKGHFYQTEVRYLLRKHRLMEVPIHYRAPSPRVSSSSIRNSIGVLFHYVLLRLSGRAPEV